MSMCLDHSTDEGSRLGWNAGLSQCNTKGEVNDVDFTRYVLHILNGGRERQSHCLTKWQMGLAAARFIRGCSRTSAWKRLQSLRPGSATVDQ